MDLTGYGWTCARGFRKEENSCLAVIVPANAQLGFQGNNWTCVEGFKKVVSACIEVAQEEI